MPHAFPPKPLNLALQGGGAHGAFTWGVLDALLEDGGLDLQAISGASAGAMNAVLTAQGLLDGGPDGARQALQDFWEAVGDSLPEGLVQTAADGQDVALSPVFKLLLHWSRYLSPDLLNPLDLNPLRDIIQRHVDFERLRHASPLRLFIAATHANSGQLRLFRNAELSLEVLLASACLPQLHRAVEIEGQPYWDGGFSANPAVLPMLLDCTAPDILLVLLTPLTHPGLPQGAAEIQARALEFTFSAPFLREMRLLSQLREQLPPARRWLPPFAQSRLERRLGGAHFHLIEAADVLGNLPADSKLAAHRLFLARLKQLGRERAQAWLLAHRQDLGRRSSIELARHFGR